MLVFILAVGASAFTTTPISQRHGTSTSYYWFDPSGNYLLRQGMYSSEVPSRCPDSGTNVCEQGFTQEQLIDGDPEEGPKPGEQALVIHKPS